MRWDSGVCVCERETFGGMTYVVLQHVSVYDVFLCFTALKRKPGCDLYGMCYSSTVFAANNISDLFSCHC